MVVGKTMSLRLSTWGFLLQLTANMTAKVFGMAVFTLLPRDGVLGLNIEQFEQFNTTSNGLPG